MANVKSFLKALISNDTVIAAELLADLDNDTMKAVRNNFNIAYSEAKELQAKKVAELEEQKKAREAELQATIESIQAAVSGLDLEVVIEMAHKALAVKYGEDKPESKPKKWIQERVTVVLDNGEEHLIPVRGNCIAVVLDAIKESGMTREEWIESHRKIEA
ncbi:hypothetical protein GNZ01_07580 [Escherichia coli]|uniref:Uncharacterized protein n=2 Tax=root TaxID=1 RepID=A0AAJ2Y492_ECOLX|nr:hypothetical protein [Escherichia coli]YP_009101864.1 hypothetical protein PBI_121Q_277 [Escherichia phage 121Q]MED6562295.1 hypothetical protein [Escherichia coli O157]AIT14167.1 hypothetical protein PBI_121Q_277 [Escherichia phage 121Q]MUM71759.1 hypothetical protein [Escherichia coli]MUM83113.1 hypothetical protein [Escherichia coli]